MNLSLLQSLALKLIGLAAGMFLPQMTEVLREELYKFMLYLEGKALATDNPVDNAIVGLLMGILGMKSSEVKQVIAADVPVHGENEAFLEGIHKLTDQ